MNQIRAFFAATAHAFVDWLDRLFAPQNLPLDQWEPKSQVLLSCDAAVVVLQELIAQEFPEYLQAAVTVRQRISKLLKRWNTYNEINETLTAKQTDPLAQQGRQSATFLTQVYCSFLGRMEVLTLAFFTLGFAKQKNQAINFDIMSIENAWKGTASAIVRIGIVSLDDPEVRRRLKQSPDMLGEPEMAMMVCAEISIDHSRKRLQALIYSLIDRISVGTQAVALKDTFGPAFDAALEKANKVVESVDMQRLLSSFVTAFEAWGKQDVADALRRIGD